MFKSIFSFDGRIRRTEFGISYLIYFVLYLVVLYTYKANHAMGFLMLLYIPLVWFLWAQGAKRCHDIEKSGWWQIIPFYVLWMLFQSGTEGENEFGEDPKEKRFFDETDYQDPPIHID